MIKNIILSLLLLTTVQVVIAQKKNNRFKDGYALKGNDTLRCKLAVDTRNDDPKPSVVLLVNDEETTFFPGGPITGFGAEDNGDTAHYGNIEVEMVVAGRRISNFMFVKKLVAGPIDFYEYTYTVTSSTSTTVDGKVKPGSSFSTSQKFTSYYIAKKDPADPYLARPVVISSFRKKDLEKYISDNADMFANAEKRYGQKELIALLKEYNHWHLVNKKSI